MNKIKLRNSKNCKVSTFLPSYQKDGFTLIELIIVMLIIGIASGFVGVLVHRGSSSRELNKFTKEVSATLRYARSRAVAEKKVYSFIIWRDKETYGLYVDFSSDEHLEDVPPVVYKIIPKPLQIISETRADYLRMDFFPQGNSSGGTLEIINQKDKAFFIIVNKVTGRVEVRRAL